MDPPGRWSETPPSVRRHAPRLGEHTVEVLREAGLDEEEVAALLDGGAAVADSDDQPPASLTR